MSDDGRAERARRTLRHLQKHQAQLEQALAYVLSQPEKGCKCRACKTLRALRDELEEARCSRK